MKKVCGGEGQPPHLEKWGGGGGGGGNLLVKAISVGLTIALNTHVSDASSTRK